MRNILLVLALLNSPLRASISRAQTSTGCLNVSTCAYGSNVTNGNMLVVGLVTGGTSTVTNLTKSSGTAAIGSFTRVSGRTFLTGAGGSELYWAKVTGTGSLTLDCGVVSCSFHLREYSATNGWPSNPFDVQATTTGTSNAPSSGNATTTAANDLLVALTSHVSGTASAGTGFGDLLTTGFPSDSEDQLNVAAGTYAGTFSLTASAGWTVCFAAFKENASTSATAIPVIF